MSGQKMMRYFVAHFERVLWEIDKEGDVRLEIPWELMNKMNVRQLAILTNSIPEKREMTGFRVSSG